MGSGESGVESKGTGVAGITHEGPRSRQLRRYALSPLPGVDSGSAEGSLERGGFYESISPWGQHKPFWEQQFLTFWS